MSKQLIAEKVIYDSRAPLQDRNDALVQVRQQAARIAELEAALKLFLVAHDADVPDETDGNELVARLEEIGEDELWYSGENLYEAAAKKARVILYQSPDPTP